MEKIEDIVAKQGGVIRLNGNSQDNEYRRILRAVQNGKLVRVKRGVYALPYALMDTMIDVENIMQFLNASKNSFFAERGGGIAGLERCKQVQQEILDVLDKKIREYLAKQK